MHIFVCKKAVVIATFVILSVENPHAWVSVNWLRDDGREAVGAEELVGGVAANWPAMMVGTAGATPEMDAEAGPCPRWRPRSGRRWHPRRRRTGRRPRRRRGGDARGGGGSCRAADGQGRLGQVQLTAGDLGWGGRQRLGRR